MDYKERKEFVENLGWIADGFVDTWCNRTSYTIVVPKCTTIWFHLVEHNGSFSIANPYQDDDYFCEDPTDDEIVEFTNLVKRYYEIENNPDDHTLGEFITAIKGIKAFYKTIYNGEEEEWG